MEKGILAKDWKIWVDDGELIPFFQPILSCEKGEIYGYEVLGRIRKYYPNHEPTIESLGPFFLSKFTSKKDYNKLLELKKDVDCKIRQLALEKFKKEADPDACIFLNLSPSNLKGNYYLDKSKYPPLIDWVYNLNIDPKRVVVEITEEPLQDDIVSFQSLIEVFRNEGFRIAVDDVGSESSNLDRIGLFHPDIIKVDLQLIRHSVFSRNFQEIIQTLSKLAESLGSSLLIEGIETEEELWNALNNGSRFLQGYYFSKPQENFLEKSLFKSQLQESMSQFYNKKIQSINFNLNLEKQIIEILDTFNIKYDPTNNSIICQDIKNLEWIDKNSKNVRLFRMYMTNSQGIQITPNYYFEKTNFKALEFDCIGKNWSWRPYFFEHYQKTKFNSSHWVASSLYHDISQNLILKTFSKNLNNKIAFVDVIWNF